MTVITKHQKSRKALYEDVKMTQLKIHNALTLLFKFHNEHEKQISLLSGYVWCKTHPFAISRAKTLVRHST